MNSNLYQVARQLQAPGVITTASFNPARLTPRLRNMVRTSILSGKHTGQAGSKTNTVRDMIFTIAYERPSVYAIADHSDYIKFFTPRPVVGDVRKQIVELLEADATLHKIAYEPDTSRRFHPTREQHVHNVNEMFRRNLQLLDWAHHSASWITVINAELRSQIIDVFLTTRTPDEVELAKRIASFLDLDEEFTIKTKF